MASKIQRIEIKNLKAISEEEIDLNGCSAIIIGKNIQAKANNEQYEVSKKKAEEEKEEGSEEETESTDEG